MNTQCVLRVFYACISILLIQACTKTPDEIRLANYLVQRHLTIRTDSTAIAHLADTLLSATSWSGKVQINKSYRPDYINIYIVDGKSLALNGDERTAQLTDNCCYIGNNIIFLDDAYLKTFLSNHEVAPDPHTELMDDQDCFLYWVVGHELGHLACGHLKGHFGASALDRFVSTSTLSNKEELQADSFFVSATISRKNLRFSVQRLMINVLNSEIEKKIGKVQVAGVGIMYDYTNEHVVHYIRQPTHPEYVIRLSRMLELSAKMGHDEGIYNLVGGFIRQLKEVKK